MAQSCRDSWKMGCGQDFRKGRAQVGRVLRSSLYREVFVAPKHSRLRVKDKGTFLKHTTI